MLIVFTSCSPSTREGALKKYRDLLENKTWCEVKSKDRIVFKNGYCKKLIKDSLIEIGVYELDIKPHRGLNIDWYLPHRSIKIKTKSGNNFFLKLQSTSSEKLIVYENSRNKTILFLSDDCVLSASDSIPYAISKEHNYKIIDLK